MPEVLWIGLAAWIGGLLAASGLLLWQHLQASTGQSAAQLPPTPQRQQTPQRQPFAYPDLPLVEMELPPAVLPPEELEPSVDDSTPEDEDDPAPEAAPSPEPETQPPSQPFDDGPLVLIHQGWSAEAVLRQLEESSPQVQSLYLELGYSLADERQCEELLSQIRQQIQVEIPDPERFRLTLNKLIEQAQDGASSTPPVLLEARRQRLDDPLLRSVLEVLDDDEALLDVLNRNPVMEALPFVEQIPIYRDGKVSWRTPVELKILRKRPRDPGELIDHLSDLHRTIRSSELRRPPVMRDAVLDAIDRVERDLQRPNAYLPTSLRTLISRVEEWLHQIGPQSDPERRHRLDTFLRQVVEVRHCFDNAVAMHLSPERREELLDLLAPYHRTTLELGDHYLHSSWLQRPLLTSWLVHNLLNAELATVALDARRDRETAGGVLAMICHETADGHYDCEETIRRLHHLESRGFYVHSLVFALLRLPMQRQQGVR